MLARARQAALIPLAALALAAALGLLAVVSPLLALGIALAIPFTVLVFGDLAAGFAVLAFLGYMDVLPTSGALSLAKAAGLLLVLAWLAMIGQRESGVGLSFLREHPALTALLVVFLSWSLLSMVWAEQSGAAAGATSRYVQNMLLLPIGYAALRTRRDLWLVAGALLVGSLVAATAGIVSPPDPSLVADGGRATGTIGDPNELAAGLLIGLAVAAGFVVARGRSTASRTIALVAIPLCALGIFLSLSRGGLIALGAMLVAGALLGGRWRVPIVLALVLVGLSGVVYFDAIASLPARERVTTSGDGSGRIDLWTVAERMVRDRPVVGVGAGNFQVASPHYLLQPGVTERADLILSSAPKIAHNTYLGIAAELGLTGLALFLAIVVVCLRAALRAARIWSHGRDPTMEALARGVLVAMLGMLVADFFISEMFSKLLWTLLALGPALLALAQREQRAATIAAPLPSGSVRRALGVETTG